MKNLKIDVDDIKGVDYPWHKSVAFVVTDPIEIGKVDVWGLFSLRGRYLLVAQSDKRQNGIYVGSVRSDDFSTGDTCTNTCFYDNNTKDLWICTSAGTIGEVDLNFIRAPFGSFNLQSINNSQTLIYNDGWRNLPIYTNLSCESITGEVWHFYYSDRSTITLPLGALGDKIWIENMSSTEIRFDGDVYFSFMDTELTGITLTASDHAHIELEVIEVGDKTCNYRPKMSGSWIPSFQTKKLTNLNISDLRDVDISTASARQILAYDGGWKNTAPTNKLFLNSAAVLVTANYIGLGFQSAVADNCEVIFGDARIITSMAVRISVAVVSGSRTFTLYKNGIATSMIATFSGSTLNATVTGSISCGAFDEITIYHTVTGTPTGARGYITINYY